VAPGGGNETPLSRGGVCLKPVSIVQFLFTFLYYRPVDHVFLGSLYEVCTITPRDMYFFLWNCGKIMYQKGFENWALKRNLQKITFKIKILDIFVEISHNLTVK
jgi:hypothetical protein